MRKVISLIMAAALSLSAAACDQNSDSSVADKSSSQADSKPAVESRLLQAKRAARQYARHS